MKKKTQSLQRTLALQGIEAEKVIFPSFFKIIARPSVYGYTDFDLYIVKENIWTKWKTVSLKGLRDMSREMDKFAKIFK